MGKVIDLGITPQEPELPEVPLFNAKDEMQRQPSADEMHQLLRAYFIDLSANGEISETTLHKLCWFVDRYVPLLDGKWWTEEGGHDDV